MGPGRMAPSWQKEVDDFPEYYAEYFKKYSSAVTPLRRCICTGRSATSARQRCRPTSTTSRRPSRATTWPRSFMPSTGPSGFGRNKYYDTDEEYLHAVAEAMREEYLGDRRRRLRAAGRRPVADRHAERPDDGRARSASSAASSTSRRSTTRCAASRPSRSATTRATASTTARG